MSDEPDRGALFDQMFAGLADFARLIRGYHLRLVAVGFSQEQALALTMQYQSTVQQIAATQRDDE